MRFRACHYVSGELIDGHCQDGHILALTTPTTNPIDVAADWVAPALFDLQINGAAGISFNSPQLTRDGVRRVIDVCCQHGIGGFLPTLVTGPADALRHGFATIREACDSDPSIARSIPGMHLEGPYISSEDGPRGAHPRPFVRKPDWNEFQSWQDAAGGRIRLVTLAPEVEGALPFIERLTDSGVVVALGHTAATGSCIRDAIRAGARLSTHLGNGSHAVLPRHDNYIWEQMAADELWASLICDGQHLPPAVMSCLVRVKTPARTVLTCDASSLAGLPPGRYHEWDQEFEILPTGRIVVSGTAYLAGSWAFTDTCLTQALTYTGVSLREAVDMASAQPRQLLRLPALELAAGAPADLILFNWKPGQEVRVVATVLAGALTNNVH
jgi:N-acetylglucosamine-6-phosphate deacetylase